MMGKESSGMWSILEPISEVDQKMTVIGLSERNGNLVRVVCCDWVRIGHLISKGVSAFFPFQFWCLCELCLGELGWRAAFGRVVIGRSWNWGWRVV